MNTKCVTITWLSKVDLSNLNSGEGGGGNVVELKLYRSGRRPYASGQSVRHALREAIERGNPGCFKSTPEAPTGDIKEDWLCDLFGYLSPRKGEGSDRRWSPIKCTPALAQLDGEIVTDLLLRMSDLEKSEAKSSKDQRLAYVQLAENVFRTGMTIDVHAIGRKLIVEGNTATKTITKREWKDEIDENERLKRVKAILMALPRMGDFAKQARNATSFAPDLFFAAVLPDYTQRGLRVLELDENGNVDLGTLQAVADDLKQIDGAKLFLGHTPNVVCNDKELLALCAELNIETGYPVATLQKVADAVN
jgi:CRISPR-associated protein Cst2